MTIPKSDSVSTVGELLEVIEAQADSARRVANHLAMTGDADKGSLRAVLAAQIESLGHNLNTLRSAVAGSDALDEPLGDILEFFAGNGKAASEVLDDTARRITRIIEDPADSEPE